jgi:hypothetical protein
VRDGAITIQLCILSDQLFGQMKKNILNLILIGTIYFGCSKEKDQTADIEALLKIHAQQQEAHLNENAALMGGATKDFISVNRGRIDSVHSEEKDNLRWKRYFDAVEFKKWDDLSKPKIRFSNDHSLAYVIVDKIVVLDTYDSLNKKIEETTHFAWVSIFRKQSSGDWKMECVVSTNEPEIVKPL